MIGGRSSRFNGGVQRGAGSSWRRRLARRASPPALAIAVALGLLGAFAPASASAAVEAETASASQAAPAASASPSEEREQRLAEKRAEHEQLIAQRHKEAQELWVQRNAERRERQVQERSRRHRTSGAGKHDERKFGRVEISCSEIVWHFEGFPEGTHTVTELASVDQKRLMPITFTFTGTHAENTTGVMLPPSPDQDEGLGVYNIDARARWGSGPEHSGWDIAGVVRCGESQVEPKFGIQKLETIAGPPNTGFVEGPLTAEVGKKIEYEIIVSNLGIGSIKFGELVDPHCDPGTITGGPAGNAVLPGAFVKYFCSHVITPADQAAGSYANTATITGVPQTLAEQEQLPKTASSQTVVVNVPTPKNEEGGKETGGGKGSGNGGGGSGSTTSGGNSGSTSAASGQLSTIASTGPAPHLEVLAVITSVPALNGRPEGCVRSSFVVSVKAKNVKSVTFYLDGHRLKTLTARSARRGSLSIRVQAARLKPGVHRLSAKLTMITTAASAKPRTVTRSLRFARCASARVDPKFTG